MAVVLAVAAGGLVSLSANEIPAPVAHYTFDDNTASDISGNNLHGTLVGGAVIASDSTRPFAPSGNRVLVLNGQPGATGLNQSHVPIEDPEGRLNFSGKSATVAAWVWMNITKTHNAIFSQGEWRRGASLTVKGDTSPPNLLWTANSNYSLDPVPLRVWTHVAAVFSYSGASTQVSFYLNGEPNGGGQFSGAITSPVNGSAIGREWRDGAAGSFRWVFNGAIDDLRLYDTALGADAIRAIYQGAADADRPPQISNLIPGDGVVYHPVGGGVRFTASTVPPKFIDPSGIGLYLNDINVSSALQVTGEPALRQAAYAGLLEPNQIYHARAVATDNEGMSSTNEWVFATLEPVEEPAEIEFPLLEMGVARQSSDASLDRPAGRAIDGDIGSISETADEPGSFWEVELVRPVVLTRIELAAPSGAASAGVVNGLVMRVFDLRDQTVFEAAVSGVAPGSLWSTNLPPGIKGRIIRFGLEGGAANEAGNHRVALAEVRAFGDPSPEYGPISLRAVGAVTQSSTDSGTTDAFRAIDGNLSTWSQTLDELDSYWLLTLDRERPIEAVELVNRTSGPNASRLQGLTVRVLDGDSNSVASAMVSSTASGASWRFEPPAGTTGRFIRIGLENGAVNGQGNRIVSLAQVSVFSGVNFAVGADSYMTRSRDDLLPTSNVNDGNYGTAVVTHSGTVDGYFEVDMGQTRALYSVRAVASDGMQSNVTAASVSLFDEEHNTVFMQRLGGSAEIFDVELPGPVLARFVRVGLENKERTTPGSNTRVFGLKELQAFGRPAGEVGLLNFTAAETGIESGGTAELVWEQEGLFELELFPSIGSVGAQTGPAGSGTLLVSPAASTQYLLAGTNHNGQVTRHLTIEVNGQRLPARISEFVASNRNSFRDGDRDEPDWIELHNPNNSPLDLTGHGLSDNPANPMKWVFPAGTILGPQEYLIVFASGRSEPLDPEGFLHANFSLSAGGESVVLTAPGGAVVDSIVNYPPQMEDLAYGRTVEGEWAFLEPTPGGANLAAAYLGWLEPLEFSHGRGWHTNAFQLSISNPNPDSQVFYSLDGTEPAVPYTGAIPIGNTVTIRATVARAGYKSPRVQTHSYLFLEGIMASPVMSATYTQSSTYRERVRQGLLDLPTFSISVPPVAPVENSERVEREASLEIFWPDGAEPIQVNCGITHYGGAFGLGTGNPYAKKSYSLNFRARYGARKLEAPLFHGFERGFQPRGSFDALNLHAGNHDMAARGFYLSHRFAADTMLEMGSLNPHGRFVHLYINGVYWGQYDLGERLTDSFLSEYLGGRTAEYLTVKGNDNGPGGNFILGVPDPTPPGRAPWEILRANRNSYQAVRPWLDVPNLIDFMLVWNWGNAEAEFRAAGGRVPGTDRGFKFWVADADGHLRNQSGVSSALSRNGTDNSGPAQIFGALMSEGHPDFKILLADRIYKHFFNGGAMTPEANLWRMDRRMEEIADSLVAECARWGLGGRTPVNWESDAQYARDHFLPNRSGILFGMMRNRGWYPSVNPPQLNQHGGSVPDGFAIQLSAGLGTVYYTFDGSDPRLAGGGISPAASAWNGQDQFPVGANTVFKARTLHNGQWSALAEATFNVENPGAYPLGQAGPYLFSNWNPEEPAGTYPPFFTFHQTAVPDPGLDVEMDSLWTFPNNLETRSRINGLGEDGFAFINTGNPQLFEGAGYLGAAVLAVNTLGQENIRVTWTGGTVTPNVRVQGIRLQYRVGADGPFEDVMDSGGSPVEYIRNDQAGHSEVIGPVTLPAAAENQARVELRWKYYHISGGSGARAQLRVGNVRVAAGHPVAHQLVFAGTPPTAQSGRAVRTVRVEARSEDGDLATDFEGLIQVSAENIAAGLSGTLIRQASGGVALFEDLIFSQSGVQRLGAEAAGMVAALSDPIAVVALSEVIVPRYIQGAQPENNDRVPFAFRLSLAGLEPGGVYRYANRMVTQEDSETQDGAGNMILVRNGGDFIRITESPRFRAGDANLQHGELIADGDGNYSGWFVTEPSGNARFAPGNTVFVRLLLNDGEGGEDIHHFLTGPSEIGVIAFGSGEDEGSALYGDSSAPDRSFVVLYDDVTGAARPLAAAVVEATGAAVDDRYALFYEEAVAARSGRWGTIFPNGLEAGARRIEERGTAGELIRAVVSEGGIVPTRNLSGGMDAIGIRVPGPDDEGFPHWQSLQFTLVELSDELISGPLAQAGQEGVPNLLRYALGLDLDESAGEAMPAVRLEEIGGQPYLSFRHRRLIGQDDLEYSILISNDLGEWNEAGEELSAVEQTEPVGDGLTEVVTWRLPIEGGVAQRYLRLRVGLAAPQP